MAGNPWPDSPGRASCQAERPFSPGSPAPGRVQADDPEGRHRQEDQERRGQEHEGDRQVDQGHLGPSPVQAASDGSLHQVRIRVL